MRLPHGPNASVTAHDVREASVPWTQEHCGIYLAKTPRGRRQPAYDIASACLRTGRWPGLPI